MFNNSKKYIPVLSRVIKYWFNRSFVLLLLLFSHFANATSTNLGFEANFTDWTTSGTGWLSNNISTNLRTGIRSVRLCTNSTVYRKISNASLTKTVNDNISKYVTFSIYVKSDVPTSQIKLGVYDVNTGTEILQSGTSTATTGGFTELTFTAVGNIGETYYPVLYAANSISGTINIYFDDVQFYISSYSAQDIVSPTKPTTLIASCTSTSITLSISSGTDAESGLAGILILRRSGIYSDNPVVFNKTNYSSVSSAIGPMIVSGYNVVYNDSVVSSRCDNPGVTGKFTYLVYMRDVAGNYSSSTLAARIWVFNGTGLTNSVLINTELDGLYLPATCQLTVGSASTIANLSVRNSALIHIGGSVFDYGSLNNSSGGILNFDSGSSYKYCRNGNSLYPIVQATWAATSNCLITGITSTQPTGTGQTFGNLTWDCPGETIDIDLDAAFGTLGNFTLVHSGASSSPKTVWLNGTTAIKGDITRTGGTLNFRANSNVWLNGSVTQNINLAATFHKLTVENSAGIKLLKAIVIDSTLFLTDGLLNLNGFTIKILTDATINRATGTLSSSPSVPGTYNLIYTQPVFTSYELLSGLTKLTNLTINTTGTITLTKHMNVNGRLKLTSGIIATGSYEVRTFNSGTNAVSGFSVNSYINGTLNRVVSSGGAYNFPVGTSSNYELTIIDLNGTAGINNIKVVFHQSSPGLVPAGLQINGTNILDFLDYGYWTVTPNAQPVSGSYNITCKMRGASNGPSTANLYGIVKRPDASSPWQSLGTHDNSTQSITSGTVTAYRSGLTSFSDFAMGFGGNALPINVSSFELRKENQNAILNWTTASEMNNNRFEIESAVTDATGNLSFQKIGEVAGMGTTNSETDYQFTDAKNNFVGIVYYRLKQVDVNNEFTYSAIKSVEFFATPFTVSDFYPNPTGDNFSFVITSTAVTAITVHAVNSIGQLELQKNFIAQQGLNTMNMNIEKLPEGLYFIEITDQNNSVIQNKKIIKN